MHHKLRLKIAKEFDELQAQVFRLKAEVAVLEKMVNILIIPAANTCYNANAGGGCEKGPFTLAGCIQCQLESKRAQAAGEGK